MGFIYKITNMKTKKCYIGETKEANPDTRWRRHIQTIAKGRGCPALQDAVQKYGIENFKFEVLIICFDEARFELEKQYIKKYNSMVPNINIKIKKPSLSEGFFLLDVGFEPTRA